MSFVDDPSPDESSDEPSGENPEFTKLREQARELERALKAERKEKEALSNAVQTFQTQQVETAKQALVGEGVPEAHIGLFTKANPDALLTVEAFRSFAQENALASAPAPEPQAPAYQPTPGGVAGAVAQKMSMTEWDDFYRRDPAGATQVLQRGGVAFPRSPYDTNRS